FGLVALLSRANYARANASIPAVSTAAGWLVVVATDVALVAALPRDWAASGLGVGNTVGLTMAGAWLVISLRRHAGAASLRGVPATAAVAAGAATASAAAGYALARALPRAGVALVWTPIGSVRPRDLRETSRQLRAAAAKWDVTHAHGMRAGVTAAAAGIHPLIVTWHNGPHDRLRRRWLHRLLERYVCRRA